MNDDILKQLEVSLQNSQELPLAEAIFFNQLPAGWGVPIIGVGARFIYKNAAGQKIDEELIVRNVNVPAGGQTSIFGTKRLCAMSIDQTLTVLIDGKPQILGPQLSDSEPKKCLIRVSMAVIPGKSVTSEMPNLPQSLSLR